MNEKELRDYFAAAALTGFLANPSNDNMPNDVMCGYCYDLADAMLKERKRDEH